MASGGLTLIFSEIGANQETCMYMIGTYNHNGNIGVLVELECLSDANPERGDFMGLADDIAKHVAATDPSDVKELLSQRFVKNPDQTVLQLINAKSSDYNDSLSISRFIRWEHGAGENVPEPDNDPAVGVMLERA